MRQDGTVGRVSTAQYRCIWTVAASHDCAECRSVPRWRVGQNLYQGFSSRPGPPQWDQAVTAWYNEIDQFPPAGVASYQFSPSTGHYSQMVWAATARIGCGLTQYRSGRFHAR